ncbi:MAG: hypothetical protein KAX67_10715, partial [Pararheinheimera sp.]|jgi:hypothetical protein|uniref:hypothetical protein n=1 Tax=uncultured Rheinheimera sp. TaxID=400532 RepID=UPI001B45BC45|nr:hypothetical protein [uncultured Rheinheimera sp.]MBP8228507.1 hypothetical protein [Rheinheimera sp.]
MRLLSFIALFFYLSSLLPSAQFSAAQQWLESPQTSASHSLAQLTSAASPVKHMTLSDDDDNSLVQLHQKVLSPVFSQTYSYLVTRWHVFSLLPFLARAPPVVLS